MSFRRRSRVSKKGWSEMDLLMYIPKFIMIIIAFGLFAFTVNMYEKDWINTKPVEVEVFANKAYYEMATYVDDVGKTYPGVVRIKGGEGFEQLPDLDQQVRYSWENYVSAKITLTMFVPRDGSGGGVAGVVKDIYYSREAYDDWYPRIVLEGVGGVTETFKVLPVRFLDDAGNYYDGTMAMSILQYNG